MNKNAISKNYCCINKRIMCTIACSRNFNSININDPAEINPPPRTDIDIGGSAPTRIDPTVHSVSRQKIGCRYGTLACKSFYGNVDVRN